MEKGSHYNLCISDLIMGLLFIFILVLLSFMLDFQDKKSEYQDKTKKIQSELQNKTEELQNELQSKIEGLSKSLRERGRVIKHIKDELHKEGIESEIDIENGVLKLLSNVHYFDKGQYKLNEKGKEYFKKIRKVLFENVVCYSDWKNKITEKRWPSGSKDQELLKWGKERCQTAKEYYKYGLIDSILIEGHADKTPIPKWGSLWRKGIKTNLDLAVKRSIEVFQTLSEYKETNSNKKISGGNYLFALTNKNGKPLFGVTSFGNLRSHNKQKGRTPAQIREDQRQNRRVDIRFIMEQPEEIKDIADLNKKNQNKFKKDKFNE